MDATRISIGLGIAGIVVGVYAIFRESNSAAAPAPAAGSAGDSQGVALPPIAPLEQTLIDPDQAGAGLWQNPVNIAAGWSGRMSQNPVSPAGAPATTDGSRQQGGAGWSNAHTQ